MKILIGLISIFLLLALPEISFGKNKQKEFFYKSGKCINSNGAEGLNSLSALTFSTPVDKFIEINFGSAPGPFVYFQRLDAECVDLSSIADFSDYLLSPLVRSVQTFSRIWIEELNFKGVNGPQVFNNFDTPRALLEGAILPNTFYIYSNIAATYDNHTKYRNNSDFNCQKDIEIQRGNWPDKIIDNNAIFCSSNTWPSN